MKYQTVSSMKTHKDLNSMQNMCYLLNLLLCLASYVTDSYFIYTTRENRTRLCSPINDLKTFQRIKNYPILW